ncbi:hypothetical protein [Streptomyces sp. NPDC050287]
MPVRIRMLLAPDGSRQWAGPGFGNPDGNSADLWEPLPGAVE